ncbi:uncharacterized protein LOC112519335 [Cynara cardunculus var. scolymus]|uniref:uncharacterized protein LOC112519335 n=1 Tax=Cynara cardunculus var. scolymus TaxID=59895 RepID=UPI000D62EB65|nr:uncharacterized protein LOC112519335 [Cynara cardunculus var. scolymus]
MAAITVRRSVFIVPIKALFALQGLYHKVVEGGDAKAQLLGADDYLIFKPGAIDVSKWKKMDSRSMGITQKMIPAPPYTVLQILRSRGFEAYLVGGCVRDLLLKRPPKDFDVITTADLNQIRKQFHRNEVVGSRFPVCRVHIKGSVVEVTSFDTLAKDAEGKEKFLISHMPRGSDKLDLVRWKNSMHRDFTINSLFFDPFIHKIYDYNDGMKDLSELKLRTLVPAQLSFTEDSARILRGLRIAARLGLSLSKEIKSAILKNGSSISSLGQFRITMELNYMLSFGAAESSFSLLHKYHLLEILLPSQAAYISQQVTRSGQSSMMLMTLLSHLDKLVACDRPSGNCLWIGILAFHMALVNNPQHPFVIMTFASVLYHQSWEYGLKFARKCGRAPVSFEPETLEAYKFISDDEVAEKVKQLAMLVVDSIDVLVDVDSLNKMMAKFTGSPCSGLVFISKYKGNSTRQLFHVLAHKVETYEKGRTSFEINYDLLGKGDSLETRFVLGKIILDTMGCGVHRDSDPNEDNYDGSFSPNNDHLMNKKEDRKQPPFSSNLVLQQRSAPKKPKLIAKLCSIMQQRPKLDEFQDELGDLQEGVSTKHMEVFDISSDPENEDGKMYKPEISMPQSPVRNLIRMLETVIDDDAKSPSQLDSQNLEERLEGNTEVELDQSIAEHQRERNETGFDSLLWFVQTNCNRAIEEARDSPADMRKLNKFLDRFVDEQVQIKKVKKQLETYDKVTSIHAFQTGGKQLEASSLTSSIGNEQIESEQSEASSLTSSIGSQQIGGEQPEASSLVSANRK